MLLECLTYRRRGHYEGDAERYRDRAAQDEEWRRRDPLARLAEHERFDDGELDRIRARAAEEVERAVQFARDSPFPEPELAARLTYA
jgi:pyruvate dehydrogenase E1 component alpha subunit